MTNADFPFPCPPLRGRLVQNAPLGQRTWFGTGGRADWLFTPADSTDLACFMKALEGHNQQQRASGRAPVALTVLGAGSNVIIRDGGVEGVTVRLGGAFGQVAVDGDGLLAGAAALDANVARQAVAADLGGLAFLSGIPGSIGGACAMNAGAYGGDMAQVLDWVDIVTVDGALERLPAKALNMGYRHAELPPGAVVVRARLKGRPGGGAQDAAELERIKSSRTASQPVRARTGGSTFRNPPPATSGGRSAWQLVDAAGCRGLAVGGARISEKHCNFMINEGTATATELETLGDEVRRRVLDQTGVELHWEIKRLGRLPGETP
ncbi:UDP-N-acetylmuramate dehydrogenase [Formicincola oecophyllae]|uniref:UDP-N-acetylenolpyruvoylglucosamine reductase n=1 Tax=Formicincola oecophyllae TaxID=2558361 RepID=A0A4Y6U9G6_9PROT|nr:UDP-N-acetylmuramate dehydrogenase [Formicincola oecophyllae]QDH13011.1 UDP-N-acetylmuramate dehydrogenase [Formicincola oecophyllae]